MKRFVVGMTGASGAIYGVRTVSWLLAGGHDVALVVSVPATRVLDHELGVQWDSKAPDASALADWLPGGRWAAPGPGGGTLTVHPVDDVGASFASGSNPVTGTIISPCSMGTLARVATGVSSDLISRACDVALKERGRLVLVPREAPLSVIHLENMLRISQAGAIVFPPVPAFYLQPKGLDEMIDNTVQRIIVSAGADRRADFRSWAGER